MTNEKAKENDKLLLKSVNVGGQTRNQALHPQSTERSEKRVILMKAQKSTSKEGILSGRGNAEESPRNQDGTLIKHIIQEYRTQNKTSIEP